MCLGIITATASWEGTGDRLNICRPHRCAIRAEKISSAPPHRSEMLGVIWIAWLCIAVAFAGVLYEFSLGYIRDSVPVWIVVGAALAVAILMGVILCARGNVRSGARVRMATVLPVALVALPIFAVGGGFRAMAN